MFVSLRFSWKCVSDCAWQRDAGTRVRGDRRCPVAADTDTRSSRWRRYRCRWHWNGTRWMNSLREENNRYKNMSLFMLIPGTYGNKDLQKSMFRALIRLPRRVAQLQASSWSRHTSLLPYSASMANGTVAPCTSPYSASRGRAPRPTESWNLCWQIENLPSVSIIA